LVRLAQGEEIPTTDLSHGYSGVELNEITSVLKRLMRVQQVLLQVNLQYIASASMDDAYRNEPPFKLQGSYRNMNKLAEKVVAAMNERELEALIEDHYVGESQTLTTGAEQNLLKLAELRGAMDDAKRERWEQIKKEFKKQKLLGGAEDDPVVRITAQLSTLGDHLEGIQGAMGHGDRLERLGKGIDGIGAALSQGQALGSALGSPIGRMVERLEGIEQALGRSSLGPEVHERLEGLTAAVRQAGAAMRAPVAAAPPTVSNPGPAAAAAASDAVAQTLGGYLQRLEQVLQTLAHPQVQVRVDAPQGIEELLAQQIAIIERTLVPLVRTTNQQLVSPTKVDERVAELLELLRGVDARLREGYSVQAALPRGGGSGSGGGGRGGSTPIAPPVVGGQGGGPVVPPAVGGRGAAAVAPARSGDTVPPAGGERPGYWRAPAEAADQGAESGPQDDSQEQWRPPARFRPPSGS
ncbi:MAG: hypothetical protein AB1Z98_40005, partial [Nannocystaceae bacterium]